MSKLPGEEKAVNEILQAYRSAFAVKSARAKDLQASVAVKPAKPVDAAAVAKINQYLLDLLEQIQPYTKAKTMPLDFTKFVNLLSIKFDKLSKSFWTNNLDPEGNYGAILWRNTMNINYINSVVGQRKADKISDKEKISIATNFLSMYNDILNIQKTFSKKYASVLKSMNSKSNKK